MAKSPKSEKSSSSPVAGRTLTADDLKRLKWRSVGPGTMGGRVSDACFVPGNPKAFYVGFASGGLFYTANNGTTLKPVFDFEENTGIGAIGVASVGADWTGWSEDEKAKTAEERAKMGVGRIVWIGTGEGNGRNSSSWGNGVYRSTDGAKTWTHCGLEDSHDIPCLVVDPRDADVCYVAALGHLWGPNPTRGVYKSTDGGKTWTPVLTIDENTGCCWLAMHPSRPDWIYAAMYARRRTAYSYQSGGPEGGIYRSKDGGKSWEKLTKGLPATTGRIGFDIFAGDPNVMIAVVQSNEGGTSSIRDDRSKSGGVFRSEDGGDTWERLSVRTPRAFYFCKIKFDPKDSQRVYLLGWEVEVSDDGGRTFRGGFGEKMHVDMHAIAINPDDPDHLLVGSDGGIYLSFDRGETWRFLNQIAVGQFYNIAVDNSEPYRIAGGLQDNGTWVGPSRTNRETEKYDDGTLQTGITNADWQLVLWGDGFQVDFDPTDPNVVYGEWQGGNLTRIDMASGKKTYISPQQAEGGARFRFNWNSPFFVSPHDPTVLYLGGNFVFRMTEKGDKWTVISPDLTKGDPKTIETVGSNAETFATVVALSESPIKAGVLWAGSDDGLIHVTTDGGKTWKNVTPDAVNGLYVSRVVASAHDVKRAFASVDGHRSDWMDPLVLATDDGGKSWSDVTGDLPKGRSVKVVKEDPHNPNVLYAGTENGFFATFDRGAHWVRLNAKSLPHCPVDDVVVQKRERDLVLGTHGRSIYVLDDAAFLWEATPEVLEKRVHLFSIRDAKPEFKMTLAGLWDDATFRAANPPVGAILTYWLSEAATEDVSITVKDAKGQEVYRTSGPGFAGINRVVWDTQPKEKYRLPDKGEEPWMPFYVPVGEYTVEVKTGDQSSQTSLFVRQSPR